MLMHYVTGRYKHFKIISEVHFRSLGNPLGLTERTINSSYRKANQIATVDWKYCQQAKREIVMRKTSDDVVLTILL